jgi:hypothetical protein
MQNETVRVIERRSKLANKQNNNRNGGDQKLLVGSEEDIHDDYEEGGVNSHSHANNRNALTTFNHHGGGHNNNNQMSAVDTVPSDHPSSTIIQTHRTCTLCHRTLSRSQFSERDRYLVHLSLGPGAVCRTCSMTGERRVYCDTCFGIELRLTKS